MNSGKYMRGFIAGSLIGIAASFFMMPQTNKNMGKRLMDTFTKNMGILKK